MKIIVRFVLVVLSLLAVASAQSTPIDVSAGYSYFNFTQPLSSQTPSEQLTMNGGDFSAAFFRIHHHFSLEANVSGHFVTNCAGTTNNAGTNSTTCSDVSYMFGPRYTYGDHSSRITVFAHVLAGQDRANLLGNYSGGSGITVTDTSFALAAGGGIDYWFTRHVGIQAGPFDYLYTNHLNNSGAAAQGSVRAAGGVAFRFGGNLPQSEPKAPKEPKAQSESHRSWTHPWHKTTSAAAEAPPTVATNRPVQTTQPVQTAQPLNLPSHGMAIHSFGAVVGPQEFDGAKVLQLEPGGVAEMASVHVGDMIKSVDGKPVRTPMELAAELSDKSGKVRIGLQRGDLSVETLILLGAH